MKVYIALACTALCAFLSSQLSTASRRHSHHALCFSEDEDDTFIQTMFSESMRRQSPEAFTIRNFLFCGTSAPERKELRERLREFKSLLMRTLTDNDLSMLRFVSTDRPLLLSQSREDLADNLITLNKDIQCMALAGDTGRNHLVRRKRDDCVILRHFRKITRDARAIFGPLSTCEVEELEVNCSGWDTEEMGVWLMSYFVANQTVHFLNFLQHVCETTQYSFAL